MWKSKVFVTLLVLAINAALVFAGYRYIQYNGEKQWLLGFNDHGAYVMKIIEGEAPQPAFFQDQATGTVVGCQVLQPSAEPSQGGSSQAPQKSDPGASQGPSKGIVPDPGPLDPNVNPNGRVKTITAS